MRQLLKMVIASCVIVVGFVGNAFANVGTVVWVNKADKLAMIEDEVDGVVYVASMPQDLAEGNGVVAEGDRVTFDIDNGVTATNVADEIGPKSR